MNITTVKKDDKVDEKFFFPIQKQENIYMKECLAPHRKTWRIPAYYKIYNKSFVGIFDDKEINNENDMINLFQKEFDVQGLKLTYYMNATHPKAIIQKTGTDLWGYLHADYFESPKYQFTALVYRGYTDDLEGGETGFYLDINKRIIVEPKINRVVLWTGDLYHAPIEVLKGKRHSTVYFFHKYNIND